MPGDRDALSLSNVSDPNRNKVKRQERIEIPTSISKTKKDQQLSSSALFLNLELRILSLELNSKP